VTIEPNPAISALWHMIGQTLETQANARSRGVHLPLNPMHWAYDFCTVKFKMARGCGHTTAGLYLAQKLFLHPVFIVKKSRQFSMAEDLVLRMGATNIRLMLSDDLYVFERYKKVDAVFVDTASEINHEQIENIYDACVDQAIKHNFCFVFLQ
jgi:hypothetical protein